MSAATKAERDAAFASAMKGLESAICDAVAMSYIVCDMTDGIDTGKDEHGHDIFRFGSGEQEAYMFAIYDLDRRLRSLKSAYYASYQVYGSAPTVAP